MELVKNVVKDEGAGADDNNNIEICDNDDVGKVTTRLILLHDH